MALREQNVDGKLSDNAVRQLRQALVTGELIHRPDAAALASELLAAREEIRRLRGVLDGFEQQKNEDLVGAWTEGWTAASDALTRNMSPDERILALVDAVAYAANPYLVRVEDLPDDVGEVPC